MKISTNPIQQLAFESFFLVPKQYSHTLELFDFCGPFVIGTGEAVKNHKLPVIQEPFSHREKDYVREIRPATLIDETGASMMYYPSKREELVMKALFYLAAQDRSKAGEDATTNCVSVTFTLHQLRTELESKGHGYKWKELDEALNILATATLQISHGKKRSDRWTAPYLSSLMSRDTDGFGEGSLRRAVFHPLASRSIQTTATRLHNYGRGMKMKNPLARWLYTRLTHFCTNASNWKMSLDADAPIGMDITLQEIFEQSGQLSATRFQNNYRIVQKALAEMVKHGLLGDMPLLTRFHAPNIAEEGADKAPYSAAFVGKITKLLKGKLAGIDGAPYVEDLKNPAGPRYTLFAHRSVVSEIMEANKDKGSTKPQDRLGSIGE